MAVRLQHDGRRALGHAVVDDFHRAGLEHLGVVGGHGVELLLDALVAHARLPPHEEALAQVQVAPRVHVVKRLGVDELDA